MAFSRRRFRGGAGALIALPALELLRAPKVHSAPAGASKRLLVYFVPNGRNPGTWIPPESGEAFSFPEALAPFQDLKSDLIPLAGLYHTSAKQSTGTGDHALGTGSILNCMPYPDGGIHGDISMDQALVKAIKPTTRFPSLQWGAGEPMACDFGASCILTQAISWRGSADKQKLEEYFTSVRELEKRITQPLDPGCEPGQSPVDGRDYEPRVHAFNDLIVLAFQCDQTRVISFMIENGLSGRSHPFIGSTGCHHALTHGAGPGDLAQLIALEKWQSEMAADVAKKLKATLDVDGVPLLDNTAMLVLPDTGAGAIHDHENLAPLLIGSCGGALHTNQALKYATAPLGNMYVSLLQAFGVETSEFGVDGTAPLPGLLA